MEKLALTVDGVRAFCGGILAIICYSLVSLWDWVRGQRMPPAP